MSAAMSVGRDCPLLPTSTAKDGDSDTMLGLIAFTETPEPTRESARFFATMMSAALRTEPVMLPVRKAFWPLTPTMRPYPASRMSGITALATRKNVIAFASTAASTWIGSALCAGSSVRALGAAATTSPSSRP